MYVPFEDLSEQARVWIYQADRLLSNDDISLIEKAAPTFLEGWATHGKPLKASFRVMQGHFLIIGLEDKEQEASGCSIDSSVAFIKALEKELEVSFMDRGKVAFMADNTVFLEPLPQLKNSIASGRITADTKTFNNLISNKLELDEKWLMPAKETWLKRYFN